MMCLGCRTRGGSFLAIKIVIKSSAGRDDGSILTHVVLLATHETHDEDDDDARDTHTHRHREDEDTCLSPGNGFVVQ